jgi:hypothetical protein
MSTPTAKFLVAASAVAVASAAFAQPQLGIGADETEIRLVEQIDELHTQSGPTAADLIEPLRALALLYQEDGEHARASVALEEARYITRVNHGLSSVDEALLLREQVRSEKARGDLENAWTLEQEMIALARQHLDDIRVLPIFRDLAEDRLELLARVRAGEIPPEVYIRCYYGPQGNCRAGSAARLDFAIRSQTLRYYASAIKVILASGDYASQELRDLEKEALRVRGQFARGPLARRGLLYSGGLGSWGCVGGTLGHYLASEILGSACLDPGGANVGNVTGLMRLVSYEVRSGAPAAVRANAVAELADWHLLGAHNDGRSVATVDETARSLYELAYRELQKDADAAESTVRIFAPELPVTLPVFEPNPFASPSPTESLRYVDVAFAITIDGRGERIEIRDPRRSATRAEERDLIRLIEQTSFRPRVVDGTLAASAPVVVRYYLPEASASADEHAHDESSASQP